MKTILLTVCLLTALISPGSAFEPQLLKQGTLITSPNGEFTVRYGYRSQDNDNVLSVSNNRTGELYKSVSALPCYLLKWTPDSRTMVAIYAISGGDTAIIIYFNGSAWEPFCPGCPDTDAFLDTSIIKMQLRKDQVRLSLVGLQRPSNTAPPLYYLVSFDVVPSTRSLFNHQKVEIDKEKFEKLLKEAKL